MSLLAVSPAWAGPARVAMVIGVSRYETVRPLKNTVGDAELVGDALRKLGFTVTPVIDPDLKDLAAAIAAFQRQANGADAAVIYFAGHGAEVAGVNYLFPRDASNASLNRMIASGMEASKVREAVLHAKSVRLVILDACRDNPATSGQLAELKNGLARETGGSTTEVVTLMAAAPGQAALDGSGDHSPFAVALDQALQRPRLTTGELPRLVQSEVETETGDRQSPDLQGIWIDIYWSFAGKSVAPAQADADAKASDKREKAFWQTIRDSTDPADFQAYIDESDRGEFSGLFRPLALNRIHALTSGGATRGAGAPTAGLRAQARAAFQRADYAAAIGAWKSAAARGDGAAAYNLGVMAFTGQGEAKDQAKAARWFEQAAKAGNQGGMVNYGLTLLNGYGVAANQIEGVRWLRTAAEAGLPSAMGLMGQIYLQGVGVPRDLHQGVSWLQRAADAGDGPSMLDLAGLYQRGEGVRADRKAALDVLRRAAAAGQSQAMVQLGYAYEDGNGVGRDLVQAATWYQRAAEAGNAEGMSALGVMLESGRGLPQDYARAADSYRQAANRGNARGLLGLGTLYAQGQGVTQDDVTAVQLFQRAADAGSAAAWRNLGVMYEAGRGVAKNLATAEEFYRKGAAAGDTEATADLARISRQ
ncbi:MAG: caspase family protein [Caulobacteraceae bacterium]